MRLQIYVLREILANFLFTAAVLSAIACLAAALVATYRIPGAPPMLVLGYVPILIMYIFPYLLPMSLLVGVVLTYGRLSAENEITAVRAGGVHLWGVFSPSLLAGLLVAGAVIPLVHDVIPRYQYQKSEYLREAAVNLLRNLNPSLHSFTTPSFRLEWEAQKGPYLEDVYLFYRRGGEGSQENRFHADRASIEAVGDDLVVALWGSHSLGAHSGGGATEANMDRFVHRIPFDDLSGSRRFAPAKDSECTSAELAAKLARGRAAEPERATFEIQKRSATVISGLLFAAIGVPIGIFLRRGTRLAAFAAAFLTVLGGYYPVVYAMEMLMKQNAIHPILAAWVGSGLLALLASVLLWKLFRI